MQDSSDVIEFNKELAESLKVSPDGYIRMSRLSFMELPLVHFLSGLDDDSVHRTFKDDTEASISGYTEWLSTNVPTVTVGWDWQLNLATGIPQYIRDGLPRSNIMITDSRNDHDLGGEATAATIASRIDQLAWNDDVRNNIALRYA